MRTVLLPRARVQMAAYGLTAADVNAFANLFRTAWHFIPARHRRLILREWRTSRFGVTGTGWCLPVYLVAGVIEEESPEGRITPACYFRHTRGIGVYWPVFLKASPEWMAFTLFHELAHVYNLRRPGKWAWACREIRAGVPWAKRRCEREADATAAAWGAFRPAKP